MNTEMNRSVITILTGAGFSVPAGFPTAKRLGEVLLSINERDYFIHTDQVLYPDPSGEVDGSLDSLETLPNLLSFLREYAENINTDFNYEDFFDKINHLQEEMPLNIREKVLGQNSDNLAAVELLRQAMVRAFQQLLKYQLMIEDERFDEYDGFLKFIRSFSPNSCINIHTLNHDTFMERLLSRSGVEFSDGFSDDSPYYYQPCGSGDKIKSQVYDDAYPDTGISLYKLHGSINYFKSYIATGETQSGLSQYRAVDVFKCNGIMGGDMYIKTGEDYKPCFALDPLFLSGTKSKIENYKGLYIEQQIQHFQENVSNADIMLVVGYGFADSKINEYILNNLKHEARVIVVDKYLTKKDVLERLCINAKINLIVHSGMSVQGISPSLLL